MPPRQGHADHAEAGQQRATFETPTQPDDPVAGHVLIVDDDGLIRAIISETLEDAGYRVATAPNGTIALQRVLQRRPGLIFLDVWMRDMDGLEFVQRYHQLPGPLAPIVLLSGALNAAALAVQVGAVAVVAKPFDLDQLLDVAGRYVLPVVRPWNESTSRFPQTD